MEYLVAVVNKYQKRLDVNNDNKKIMRALQKLDELDMTIGVLQATGVGKAVNNMKKVDGGVGDLAREVVAKWKKLLQCNGYDSNTQSANEHRSESESSDNDEYDPTRNWEMNKTKTPTYQPAKKYIPSSKKTKITYSRSDSDDGMEDNTSNTEYAASNRYNHLDSDDEISYHQEKSKGEVPNASSSPVKLKHKSVKHKHDKTIPRHSDSSKKHASQSTSKKKTSQNSRHSSSSGKRKSTDPIDESSSKKSKNKSVKEKKGDGISFEQFMTMDTSKAKKKKKSVKNSSSLSTGRSAKSSSSKHSVELHLPEIQPNYRPLPASISHLNHSASSSGVGHMTDAMAAELHTQRNSKKMQIYSGKKTTYLPKMLSLYDQCMNVLMNNVDKLDMIGVPYDIIKPVLERCTVEQLYRLEDINVYLLDDTDELWMKHSMQDFRSHEPEEMESWREMYLRLHDAREAKLARLTQSIQTKVDKAKPLEKRTKLAYVGISQPKAPRNVLRAQLKYGTAGRKPMPFQAGTSSSPGKPSSGSIMQRVTEARMVVPVGAITADVVDSRSYAAKKQPPRIAPMMAKTLKSINKLRYKR